MAIGKPNFKKIKKYNATSIIKIRTTIGHGSSKEGTAATHGAALGAADLAGVKTKMGFDAEQSFHVPVDVKEYYNAQGKKGAEQEQAWKTLFSKYAAAHPELAKDFLRREKREFPEGFLECKCSLSFSLSLSLLDHHFLACPHYL